VKKIRVNEVGSGKKKMMLRRNWRNFVVLYHCRLINRMAKMMQQREAVEKEAAEDPNCMPL
jgi:hypothetical protein